MAIAPVNKFISLAVPVAPGLQKLYEVPTGTSALVLYAQVSNVGIGTYPTVTFLQRRESRSTGLTRDIRVLKEIEIPPNDGVVLIDGRMVLEKTPTVLDRIFIKGQQTGVSTVNDVKYDEPFGIATVTTLDAHGFLKGDQITMGGIAFTCANNNSGITTTIFPDPQASYTIIDVVDTKKFSTSVGSANGITHFFNPAIHTFVRAEVNAVERVSTGTKFTPTEGNYIPKTGILTLNIPNHGILSGAATKNVDSAIYDAASGIMTVTSSAHGLNSNSVVKFLNNELSFKCAMDGNTAIKTYPRETDPVSGVFKPITYIDSSTFSVDVGASPHVYYKPTAVIFDTTAGIMTCTIGANTLRTGTSIRLATGSLTFQTGGGNVTYPQSGNTSAYNTAVGITSVTTTTVTLNVGTAGVNTPGELYTFVDQTAKQPTDVVYNPTTGVMTLTINNHGFENGDAIKIANNSITLSCTYGNKTGISSHSSYPRSTDPASDTFLRLSNVTTNTFDVQVGNAGIAAGNIHIFVTGAPSAITASSGGPFTAATGTVYDPTTGVMTIEIGSHSLTTSDTVQIANGGITFTCDADSHTTNHAYPRATDPASGQNLAVLNPQATTIDVQVGNAGIAGGNIHHFQSATAGVTWSVVKSGSADYAHTWAGDNGVGGVAANAMQTVNETIGISTESIIFTCSQDGNDSEHGYPRTTDPAHNTNLPIIEATADTISVNVGVSTAGGLVAPLQMEFLASILENNNA